MPLSFIILGKYPTLHQATMLDYLWQPILDYRSELSQTILGNHPQTILYYLQLTWPVFDHLGQLYRSILDNCLQLQIDISNNHRKLSTIAMAILGNFETTMTQKQSMVILVNYKENYDTTTTTIQWVLTSVQFNLVIYRNNNSNQSHGFVPNEI